MRVLVTGATGRQGGSVARELLSGGFVVRALTRRPASQRSKALAEMGVEVVAGNLSDRASIRQAMKKVDGVFSVQNYWDPSVGFDVEITQARNLAEAALDSGTAHFVQSSMAAASDVSAVRHFESKRRIEQILKELSVPHTLIGTVYFMDNLFDRKMGGSMTFPALSGGLDSSTRLHLLSSNDIGRVVRRVFSRREEYLDQRVNLAGDQMTVEEMKTTYSQVMCKRAPRYWIPRPVLRLFAYEFAQQLDWHNAVNFDFSFEASRRSFSHLSTFEEFLVANRGRLSVEANGTGV